MTVYNAFGCASRYVLYDGREVTGSDEQLGGIKGDFPLGGAVPVYQLDETLEYFFLTVDAFRLFLEEEVLGLVIEVQEEILDEVFEDLQAEAVVFIFIKVFYGQHHADHRLDAFFGNNDAGVFFQEMEERGVQTGGDFFKQEVREVYIRNGEVVADVCAVEDASGQKYQLGMGRYLVGLQVYFYMGFATGAKDDGSIFQLGDLVGGTSEEFFCPGYKRFVF